jgi:hypothetical protein
MNNFYELIKQYQVTIPPIQRDYAHGRKKIKAKNIRKRFIDSIFETLNDTTGKNLFLDFVYGYVEVDTANNQNLEIFKPLDGQQRLTTLFLLYWYVANRENQLNDAKPLLKKFTYETRKTTSNFCEKLVNFNLDLNSQEPVHKQIINQPWYFSIWNNDPSIQSMLVVLATIEEKYNHYIELPNTGLNNLWQNLTSTHPKIQFELLSMKELGLADDLYIKMNARGKSLTDFEHFKSHFSTIISPQEANYFNIKIDNQWTDLFWKIFKDRPDIDLARFVDAGFLNFFNYVTDIIIVKEQLEYQLPQNELKEVKGEINIQEIIDKANLVYKGNAGNVKLLFDWLDMFEAISQDSCHFQEIFYINDIDFTIDKVKLFGTSKSVNLFNNCIEHYKTSIFSLMERLLLYTFIQINIAAKQVPQNFYRLVRNLLANTSDNQFRESNLLALYEGIDNLIEGERAFTNLPFTRRQLNEELEKKDFLSQNNALTTIIFQLEDHSLLKGSIGILYLDETIEALGPIFLRKFQADQDLLATSKALLAMGMYPQTYTNGTRKRFGNAGYANWEEILTHSENRNGFENTKEVLKNYLTRFYDEHTNDMTIVNDYMSNNPVKNISYYMLKYDTFIVHEGSTFKGFYSWSDYNNAPYNCMMLAGDNFKGKAWSPFLYELQNSHNDWRLEDYSSDLLFTKGDLSYIIKHENNGFKFIAPEDNLLAEAILSNFIDDDKLNQDGVLIINQDYNGVDLEDRIEKCMRFLDGLDIYIL